MAAAPKPTPARRSMLRKCFLALDTDDDAQLSAAELRARLSLIHI